MGWLEMDWAVMDDRLHTEVMVMAKAKVGAKSSGGSRRKPVRRLAVLLLEDPSIPEQEIARRYELLPVPFDDEAVAVDNYNVRRMYGADVTPTKRARTCIVFFRGTAKESYERSVQEALAYIAKAVEFDETNPDHQMFRVVQLATVRGFIAGCEFARRTS